MLVASGLTFTFGQMNVINMAHGEFIMIGAYSAYVIQQVLGQDASNLTFFVALPISFVVAAMFGTVLERLLISRLYGREIDTLLVTFGVSLLLQQLARDLFGAPNVEVVAPGFLTGAAEVGGSSFSKPRIFAVFFSALVLAGAWILTTKTRYGRRSRAVTQNRELASASGIRTSRVDAMTFAIGSGLAGVAGVVTTLLGSIGPTLGTAYIVDAFLVVIAGGLGQIRGMVIVAFAVGMLNATLESWTDASNAKVLVFVAIIAFLQVRPQGLVRLQTRSVT